MQRIKMAVVSVSMIAVSAAFAGALKLAAPFTDGMVLQRGVEAPVWGWAESGADVSVSFAGGEVMAKAGADGKWMARLPKMDASCEGRVLTVTAGAEKLSVKDVLVGEVWLCSGQSNMGIPMWGGSPRARDRLGRQYGQIYNRPLVRCAFLGNPHSDMPMTEEKICWLKADPKYIVGSGFSAIGLWYALMLHDALKVPVGMMGAYVGATCIETWIPGYTKETYTTKARKSKPNQQPARLYNGKVHPVVPYAIKGVIWYQGESNTSVEGIKTYASQMQEYYDAMARAFCNPSLKLYFAQLAPWGSKLVPDMQVEQQRFAEMQKNAGMAVICDVGNLHDIHPNEKQTVALRLALLALKRDYGFTDIIADSPTLRSWKIDGGKFVMSFNNVEKWSLYDPDWSYHHDPGKTELMGFEVAGEDGVWHPAEIGNLHKLDAKHVEYRGQIDGRELVVHSDKVAAPKALRYLYSHPWFGRLHNEAGLPLGAFKIVVE